MMNAYLKFAVLLRSDNICKVVKESPKLFYSSFLF